MLFPSWLAHILNKCTFVMMRFAFCDDSLGPLVMFTQPVYNGTEGNNATVCLTLNGEAVFDITVTLASMNGNAEGNTCCMYVQVVLRMKPPRYIPCALFRNEFIISRWKLER